MTAKHDLDAALEAADALRRGGDLAGARGALAGIAADPDRAGLPPVTALGLNRRLHAALLRQAKAEGDVVARVGLQAHLVPPPNLLDGLTRADGRFRRDVAAAQGRPVPRVIHQVWIGPRPLPPTIAAWTRHARAQGYDHRLWREGELAGLGIGDDPVFRDRLARGDWPGAVDVARYAILDRAGGVYLDADWYPARDDIGFHDVMPLAGLCALAEAIPRLTATGALLLANSFVAAPPAHPVITRLRAVLPEVARLLPGAPAWWATGPLAFTLLARGGAVTLADAGLVAGTVPGTASLEDARARALAARQADEGLLIAWKPW